MKFMAWFLLYSKEVFKKNNGQNLHCVKSVRIQSYSGPYFPVFVMNTERHFTSLHIQSEWGKMQSYMFVACASSDITFSSISLFNSSRNSSLKTFYNGHCVKSVQIQSFFLSVFSCIRAEYGDLPSKSPYSVRIQENTDHKLYIYIHT